jgi:hypothetical protein
VRLLGDRNAWLLLLALALLLTVLAVLQYRWVGEIGRAEGERLQANLDGSARRFGAALEREVGRVFFTFLNPGRADTARLYILHPAS